MNYNMNILSVENFGNKMIILGLVMGLSMVYSRFSTGLDGAALSVGLM